MTEYGRRTTTVFDSLGMRPIEILENKEGSVEFEDIVEELKDDEEVPTALTPFVKEYFNILEDEGIIEYDESGELLNPSNRSIRKNGYPDEEIESFIGKIQGDY